MPDIAIHHKPGPATKGLPRLLAAISFALLAHAARAEPALWAARSDTATIYLFGTVHLLKDDTNWRSARIDQALWQAGELWLEVQDPSDRQAMLPLVQQYGIDAAHPLSSRLDPPVLAHLKTAAAKVGVASIAMLEPMRPWMAGMFLAVQQAEHSGYDQVQGVDKILRQDITRSNRPVIGLETVQQQLMYFASLTPEAEVQMLDETLDEIDEGTQALDDIVAAWAAGDEDKIAKLLDDGFRDKDPAAYQALIVDRNAAWAERLKERLAGTGVAFVAVGAAHLAGKDSLQAELAKRGVKVERERAAD
jgi:uncharacterized protein YbaP (TraB family)